MINLISDTVTKPTPGMLEAMMQAEVGDDVFREDPTVNALEEKVAQMFGKEAALYCPSGTMTNQIAIKVHTQPLDEVICDEYSHIYQYETAGYAYNSGVGINLIKGTNGKITAEQVAAAIKPRYDWLPISRLVVLENTCNKGGGSYYTLEEIRPIQELCREKGLALHLDGARLFNALVETGERPQEVGAHFDSVSLCLSKGLGAPVGSVLIGRKDFIQQARRLRKVMGGGMRQAGYLAAACIYALDHQVERLREDNERARRIGEVLQGLNYVESVRPVQSNILIFDLVEGLTADKFLEELKVRGVNASAFGPQTVRFVTHLDFTEQMMDQVLAVLKQI
ncbi:MAG: threonine aldolase family protein [Phaeodactylibacter xiamenensis]|uniref:Threonine aldolase n=1 Tax=Phaeodactylibacter xiamenensis TaxID=1524460 RepID=A0A098S4T3_9BACT|nr:GntG family PLP-dependent aldolase [Phaeodactylibacter xiamenensis]KGE87319.1 threonine aldolase [Phaeodactylibacter xiamenensis]MCR9055321.1 aminotransferase class I/II-fold pyridoxal phosphate-dependent enzyme [bacterium]